MKLERPLMQIKHTRSVFSIKQEETVRLCKNVEWNSATTCNISVQLVSLKKLIFSTAAR